MLTKTVYGTLLLLTAASFGVAQVPRPSEAQWMDAVTRGRFASREVHSQQVEPHGSVMITTGQIVVKLKAPFLTSAGKSGYSVWFLRMYRAKDGGWELVSHRTVAESS